MKNIFPFFFLQNSISQNTQHSHHHLHRFSKKSPHPSSVFQFSSRENTNLPLTPVYPKAIQLHFPYRLISNRLSRSFTSVTFAYTLENTFRTSNASLCPRASSLVAPSESFFLFLSPFTSHLIVLESSWKSRASVKGRPPRWIRGAKHLIEEGNKIFWMDSSNLFSKIWRIILVCRVENSRCFVMFC